MDIKNYARSLRPDPKNLKSDLVSGFATGLFSIPGGMAYAQLAGVNPLYGLYSGIVATMAASLSTGTLLMISTLTSAIARIADPATARGDGANRRDARRRRAAG